MDAIKHLLDVGVTLADQVIVRGVLGKDDPHSGPLGQGLLNFLGDHFGLLIHPVLPPALKPGPKGGDGKFRTMNIASPSVLRFQFKPDEPEVLGAADEDECAVGVLVVTDVLVRIEPEVLSRYRT